jgi:hypothetical protein
VKGKREIRRIDGFAKQQQRAEKIFAKPIAKASDFTL